MSSVFGVSNTVVVGGGGGTPTTTTTYHICVRGCVIPWSK